MHGKVDLRVDPSTSTLSTNDTFWRGRMVHGRKVWYYFTSDCQWAKGCQTLSFLSDIHPQVCQWCIVRRLGLGYKERTKEDQRHYLTFDGNPGHLSSQTQGENGLQIALQVWILALNNLYIHWFCNGCTEYQVKKAPFPTARSYTNM